MLKNVQIIFLILGAISAVSVMADEPVSRVVDTTTVSSVNALPSNAKLISPSAIKQPVLSACEALKKSRGWISDTTIDFSEVKAVLLNLPKTVTIEPLSAITDFTHLTAVDTVNYYCSEAPAKVSLIHFTYVMDGQFEKTPVMKCSASEPEQSQPLPNAFIKEQSKTTVTPFS